MLVFMNCAPVWPVLSEDIYEGCVHVCVSPGEHTVAGVLCPWGKRLCVGTSRGRHDSLTQQRGRVAAPTWTSGCVT